VEVVAIPLTRLTLVLDYSLLVSVQLVWFVCDQHDDELDGHPPRLLQRPFQRLVKICLVATSDPVRN